MSDDGGGPSTAVGQTALPFDAPALRVALRGWYAVHRRALPWRDAADPYAIWVSEVMLQQTRAAAVEPYFRRWMARFPTVTALAAANEDDVLSAWQGLGYYSRARNLRRAARTVVADHGGTLPRAYDDLAALPGIGPYTAGAISSIAFGARVPAIDGNVRRVVGRLLAARTDVARGEGARAVEVVAAALADGDAPGDVNQALMELGATVCAPRRPACPRCPAAPWCAARAAGEPADFPPRRPRARPRSVAAVAWLVTDPDGRMLVARRASDGLLGGLWEFPLTPPDETLVDVDTLPAGPALSHAFTHIALTVTPVRAHVAVAVGPMRTVEPYVEWRWLDRTMIDGLPVSTLMRKLLGCFDAFG